jgi:hypothetical protein
MKVIEEALRDQENEENKPNEEPVANKSQIEESGVEVQNAE